MNSADAPPSQRRLAGYFVPLALQAASQSLTYPLVAMVASHGPGGTLNLAGVAQSNIVMFLTSTIGAGLITSGMVYAQSRAGFERFVSVNRVVGLISALIQALICIPPAGHLVFGILLGLPPSIEAPATQAFPVSIVLNLLFFARNPYQVLLYNNEASGRASTATFLRIGLTLALSPVFCSLGLVGARWAMVCQALPVGVEVIASWLYSRPFSTAFPESDTTAPGSAEILWFNLPLSLGGFLMTLSGMLLGAVISRAGQPERMLPAYYLALGLAGPMAYAGTRVQNVVLCFPPASRNDTATIRFSFVAGIVLSLIPLIFLLPWLAQWYYVTVQRLNAADLPLVYVAALLLVAYPVTAALKAHREGLAALGRRTSTILAGNAASVAALAILSFAALALKVPGNQIGPAVLAVSNLAGLGTLVLLLREDEGEKGRAAVPVIGQEG